MTVTTRALVDTGMRDDGTASVWRASLASLPKREAPKRIYVTHLHPDHAGMAGCLTRQPGARWWMTRLETSPAA
ncbi:MBL fold metallo-hydrolase [Variovorax sp. J22R133]|uniref:MBL fold metallo-hydrolase n=1 Tax=Variovorax brevis TaxID=3053503 RepID=UPI00257683A1|nr:MBL fold metallo-hydrolase [Variovorax sp. J22R133]MDM0118068.1 MBL fold metallo-hydrolase [Variovorax sp. J22R133]